MNRVFYCLDVSESSADVEKPQSLKDETELAAQTDPKVGEAILANISPRSISPPPNLASGSSQVSDSSMDCSGFLSSMNLSAELSIGDTGWLTSDTHSLHPISFRNKTVSL